MNVDLMVVAFRHGPFWNFTYLVGSRAAGEAVVIDPAWDVAAVQARAATERLRITAAVVTHAHDDHAHGLAALTHADVATLVHHADAADLGRLYDGPVTAVEDGHELPLGGHTVRLLHTPGHTAGSQCALVDGALFTGDTLMIGSVGRAGPSPGAVEALWRSVAGVIAALPDATTLYPGHDYGRRPHAALGDERRTTPGLAATEFEDFRRALGR